MPWSWKIGRVRGIQIFVHATFLLIVGWAAFAGWASRQTVAGALEQVAFILLLFGCIVLHELGHALMALRFGIKTRDITLLPIGGVARLERMPKEPLQELAVALAGPAVNVAIAAVLAAGLWLSGGYGGVRADVVLEGSMIERLVVVNIFLVLFNLLPAFPMDGGRALRALLATRLGALRATQIAARVGQTMAVFFGLLGLVSNPFLVLIALFVWAGASQEAAMAQAEAFLGDAPVDRVVIREIHALREEDSLATVARQGLAVSQSDFPVVDANAAVTGMVSRERAIEGMSEKGPYATVADVMRRDVVAIEAGTPLEEAFAKMLACQSRALPVVRGGRLEGLLTRENLQAYVSLQGVLARGGRETKAPAPHRPEASKI